MLDLDIVTLRAIDYSKLEKLNSDSLIVKLSVMSCFCKFSTFDSRFSMSLYWLWIFSLRISGSSSFFFWALPNLWGFVRASLWFLFLESSRLNSLFDLLRLSSKFLVSSSFTLVYNSWMTAYCYLNLA